MRSNSKTIKRSVSPYGAKVLVLLSNVGRFVREEKASHEFPLRESYQGL